MRVIGHHASVHSSSFSNFLGIILLVLILKYQRLIPKILMLQKLPQITNFKHGLANTISSMPSKLEQTNKIIGKVKSR